MKVVNKAVFTYFTCDCEIQFYFWIRIHNHSEAKGTGIFPCREQNLAFRKSIAIELRKVKKHYCNQAYNHCV